MLHRALITTFAVTALSLAVTQRADAETVVQVRPFEFALQPEIVPAGQPAPQLIDVEDLTFFTGSQTLNFNPFNPSLGDLVQVQLDLSMTISGEVILLQQNVFASPQSIVEPYPGVYFAFYGDATAGNLVAVADFGDYEVGVDGSSTPYGIQINETGDGTDMSTNPADFSDFIDFNPVLAEVYAEFGLGYEFYQRLQAQAQLNGIGDNFTAYGDLTLTYVYNVNGVIIPTPAALPAGLGLLALTLVRRRVA